MITQLQPISVIFTIAEDQLPAVYAKQNAGQKLPVDAFDRDMKKKLASGTLTTIDNEIDQTTGTVKLRATFDNSHNELFPNQFVNARLLQQEKRGVVLVPSAAVQRNSHSYLRVRGEAGFHRHGAPGQDGHQRRQQYGDNVRRQRRATWWC